MSNTWKTWPRINWMRCQEVIHSVIRPHHLAWQGITRCLVTSLWLILITIFLTHENEHTSCCYIGFTYFRSLTLMTSVIEQCMLVSRWENLMLVIVILSVQLSMPVHLDFQFLELRVLFLWLQALIKSTNRLRDSLFPKDEPKLAVPLLLLIAQHRSV